MGNRQKFRSNAPDLENGFTLDIHLGTMDTRLLNEITRNIEIALQEDQVDRDCTSLSCFSSSSQTEARLILKQEGILAGLIFLPFICYRIDPKIQVSLYKKDGEKGKKGDLLATLKGSTCSILALERMTINFIQHATTVATQTHLYVEKIQDLPCEILDTRKTLPCLRFLQKYAVTIGGGKNHRFDLGDEILIKDNHLTQLKREGKDPIRTSIENTRKCYPQKKIQIEVSTLAELEQALKLHPDRILLDNMTPSEVKQAVALCPKEIYLEASGGINLTNLRLYAETGIHGISIGRLTHSIEAVDMSLKI
jgi:nicotinate-nucleotide pyrophosphorylase (carboxylating)